MIEIDYFLRAAQWLARKKARKIKRQHHSLRLLNIERKILSNLLPNVMIWGLLITICITILVFLCRTPLHHDVCSSLSVRYSQGPDVADGDTSTSSQDGSTEEMSELDKLEKVCHSWQ